MAFLVYELHCRNFDSAVYTTELKYKGRTQHSGMAEPVPSHAIYKDLSWHRTGEGRGEREDHLAPRLMDKTRG
jgi:hypothetical protein